ncbi:MAG: hypothetical protein VKP70_09535 [Cyanobacteriota bacterium]|nr:hypothetical protein [Cyanobacteriota bacterium]
MPLVVDQQCKVAESPDSNYRIDNYFRLLVGEGKSYWLSLARSIDGMAIFCLAEGETQRPRQLPISELQDKIISEITQTSELNVFMITVAHGNGWRVPKTLYKLNLNTPDKPVLTKLKEWT